MNPDLTQYRWVVINAVYIPLSEEPGLAKRFGNDY